MSFQIKDVVLYNHEGERRKLTLNTGELNIITGESKTGKTALIDIIDYCLASDTCDIPEGVIRDAVEWVGVRLQIVNGEVFVARKIPPTGNNQSSEIYYESGDIIEIPEYPKLNQNTDINTRNGLMSNHVGIGENLFEPPSGHTRDKIAANIKHSLFFTFQKQNEISNNRQLFHKQTEQFIPQRIKDLLPYFLGAVDDDYVNKKTVLNGLNKELSQLKRQLRDHKSILGDGIGRAQDLLAEAQDFGLYRADIKPGTLQEYISVLREIQDKPVMFEDEVNAKGDELEALQTERSKLLYDLRKIKEKIAATKEFNLDQNDYSQEVNHHLIRLKSIDLFEENHSDHICPLCNSEIDENDLPKIDDFKDSINELESQIHTVSERTPQMQKMARKLNEELEDTKQKLKANRDALESVRLSNKKIQEISDYNAQRAYILGRIGLYLESIVYIEDDNTLEEDISHLEKRIDELKSEISDETVQENLKSIFSVLGWDMSNWAKELRLEHSNYPFRLDLNRLTVIVDTESASIPMSRMGSGENWLGCHIIAHLALHKWFVHKDRPVPRFLFLDQPSQVYFPEDTSENFEDKDIEAVKRIYNLILEFIQDLHPDFQIIITDHANFNEDWFQDSVRANWRDGEKLVPEDWIQTL